MHTTTRLARQAMEAGAPQMRIAHALLFERVMSRIHRYFRRVISNADEADDCFGRTLLVLEESLKEGRYDPERSFNGWLWLKAHTVFAQWCRQRERHQKAQSGVSRRRAPAQQPSEQVQERLDSEAVLAHLARHLGTETHQAFVLYYEGGLTQAEVASVLGRDRKTIRRRLNQAHACIDRLLGGNG